ncbi:MAG: lauroyl acyltransferase [Halioglobus sp.]|nr:lauroyl acyltransferase [Halioglobus sp.]
MTEFIVGNSLRRWARQHQLLRALLWRLDYSVIWLLSKLAALLPADTASRLGRAMGKSIGPLLKKKTSIYRTNMQTAFPELDSGATDALIKRAWGQVGRVLLEYPHLSKILSQEERLQINIKEPIAAYSDPATPCVIVTAHQSNWEVVCSAMAKLGMPNASLYTPPSNPMLDRLLLNSRRALNSELLPREHGARLLMRALKNGQTAAMVMDRRIDGGKPIQFFGHSKPSTILPARLALKYGCALVPVQVERLVDAHFRVTFHPPVLPRNTDGDDNALAIDMIQQVHEQFEEWIRQRPDDWFCSKRIWPKGNIPHTEEAGGEADNDYYAA